MPKKVHTEKTKARGGVDALRAIRNPLSVSRVGSQKSRAALALAVSLWIATGGVASADTTVTVESGETVQYVYNGEKSDKNPWATPRPTGEKTDYHTVINNGGTATGRVLGGFSDDSNANNNTVTAKKATIKDNVYGGYSGTGNATGNSVTLTDTTVDSGNYVYGGSSNAGAATGNSVTLIRSIVSDVIGGSASGDHAATGNTVSLTDSTVVYYVYGGKGGVGGDPKTGNTLNLSGENTAEEVINFETVNLKSATWGKTVLTAENFTNITKIDASGLEFTNPGAASGSTTLLSMTGVSTGTDSGLDKPTLTGASHTQPYTNSPLVAGVTIDGILTGNITQSASAVTYTFESNTVNKIAFGDVAWKDSGALYTRPDDVSFNNAAVDTSNINFTNIKSLAANKTMTLVSNWDGAVGTITGTKYKVGSTLEGEGKASLVGTDLIFTAETAVEALTAQEQTHNTVMGAEVGMAALAAGNDFIGAATEGLSLASNIGADGISSFAKMGGGAMRQETGSHIDVRTWNAILALGHQNKKERGTMEYGAFFEYGTGNYTTHNGDERGDGSAHYTGGGLLAKWTARHGLYVEGSLRAGSVHDDARNVLRDADGNPYSYETNAPYLGFHLGVGKEIPLKNGDAVDVYGKYFYNRRNSTDFNAGGHYDLDAVTSSVIRLGARYTVNRSKWKFYGGVAYEHELDGKAEGTADGVAIRGADTSGGSFRGELGATVTPDKNVPLTLDFNLTGFAGTKQGLSGGVSVALMF